ncbi:MAG: hypothetical protein SOR93_03495 [Clostridiales Family XIII bacterium]|uniref:hypothetical protein n=1 Tax=Hominibacterium faecale TaxID=2839743 RepID=UPI0022B29C0E|nr:hypothetical protein [Hominibacterium faecale]MCI7301834.1 hypothetical protein [Clostridia bacterium]MDY3010311.1 hypothetical protein [Clostridiales Family XIII bacterium]
MGKVVNIEIAGKQYPMSFSLMASKKIMQQYGGADKLNASLQNGQDEKAIEMLLSILDLLITQGCAYKNYFEKDVPPPENAPIIDGKWTPLPTDILEIAIGISDMEMIKEKIQECIEAGNQKNIEAVSSKKNVKTRRE